MDDVMVYWVVGAVTFFFCFKEPEFFCNIEVEGNQIQTHKRNAQDSKHRQMGLLIRRVSDCNHNIKQTIKLGFNQRLTNKK